MIIDSSFNEGEGSLDYSMLLNLALLRKSPAQMKPKAIGLMVFQLLSYFI